VEPATGISLRGEQRVSVTFFGDGARGRAFHESLNLAAVYRLPVIFVCENNSVSSHSDISERRATDNIYSLPKPRNIWIKLDGNDVGVCLPGR